MEISVAHTVEHDGRTFVITIKSVEIENVVLPSGCDGVKFEGNLCETNSNECQTFELILDIDDPLFEEAGIDAKKAKQEDFAKIAKQILESVSFDNADNKFYIDLLKIFNIGVWNSSHLKPGTGIEEIDLSHTE